jgi:hypothetical protein
MWVYPGLSGLSGFNRVGTGIKEQGYKGKEWKEGGCPPDGGKASGRDGPDSGFGRFIHHPFPRCTIGARAAARQRKIFVLANSCFDNRAAVPKLDGQTNGQGRKTFFGRINKILRMGNFNRILCQRPTNLAVAMD